MTVAEHAQECALKLQVDAARRELDRIQRTGGLRHEPGIPCPLCNPSMYPHRADLPAG